MTRRGRWLVLGSLYAALVAVLGVFGITPHSWSLIVVAMVIGVVLSVLHGMWWDQSPKRQVTVNWAFVREMEQRKKDAAKRAAKGK